jgi:hypothetical protein
MIRAFQWDLARQVERLDWLIEQLPRYADWGYQELYLHLEDAVDYPRLPGVARADAYAWRELDRLVRAATRAGLGVVPIVNLLGHTDYLLKVPALRDLNECRAPDGSPLPTGQICPLHPRTPEVVAALLDDVAPWCTTGKVHVGLDEARHLGQHPLSRAEIAAIGPARHLARHVQRLRDLAADRGLRVGMWADMLALLPEAIPHLPADVIAYDWYYHAFRRHPRVEQHNFAEIDLTPAFRAHGLAHWGCPMNGAFRHEPLPIFGERLANILSWWQRGHRTGAAGLLITSWEGNRLAQELCSVIDAAAASLWLDGDADDHPTLLARGFRRALGLTPAAARVAARAALAADNHAFAGYARWEINQRWDSFLHRIGPAPLTTEARFWHRLRHRDLPAPFLASVAFRHYLAQRDVFVREAARGVTRLRRHRDHAARQREEIDRLQAAAKALGHALTAGRRAARAMWRLTRAARARGPNDLILAADAQRLRDWRTWLRAAARDPAHAFTASPVLGRWQLQLTVHNLRPAVQQVVLQHQDPTGTWHDLSARYTIEFRTPAARRRTKISREWSVPVADPAHPLRLLVRGHGEVWISHVQLTDGVTTRPARGGPRQRRRLGRPAQPQGRASTPSPAPWVLDFGPAS